MILAITVPNFLNVYVQVGWGGRGVCRGCSLKALYNLFVYACMRKCMHVSNFLSFGIFLCQPHVDFY